MEQELTEAGVHELLDRTYMISEIVELHLLGHQDIDDTKLVQINEKLNKAHDLLLEAYQDLGAVMGEF